MATLYLMEQGAVLRKESKRLIVEKQSKTLLEVPLFKVDRVLIFGNVHLTTPAISFLLSNGIDTSFLTVNGRFKGRLTPIESKNVFLRMKQYEKHIQPQFKLSMARRIVTAKIQNARTLLIRYARNHPEVDLERAIKELQSHIENIPRKQTVKSLMGVEGAASATYFGAFGKLFRRELQFDGRARRPPRDPVNSLLSFGYTLLTNEMVSLTCAMGFDPYIGYFHGLDYSRPSLALDLIEEFRHPIIDRLILFLVNNRVITEKDFENRAEEGVFLSLSSRKTFFVQYEKYMKREVESNLTTEKKAYRALLRLKVERFRDAIMHEIQFQPYLLRD